MQLSVRVSYSIYNNQRLTDTSVACSSFTEPDVGREMNLVKHASEQIAGVPIQSNYAKCKLKLTV